MPAETRSRSSRRSGRADETQPQKLFVAAAASAVPRAWPPRKIAKAEAGVEARDERRGRRSLAHGPQVLPHRQDLSNHHVAHS